MRRTTFNDGWRVRPFGHSLLETGESGAPWTQAASEDNALGASRLEAARSIPTGRLLQVNGSDAARAAVELISSLEDQ